MANGKECNKRPGGATVKESKVIGVVAMQCRVCDRITSTGPPWRRSGHSSRGACFTSGVVLRPEEGALYGKTRACQASVGSQRSPPA